MCVTKCSTYIGLQLGAFNLNWQACLDNKLELLKGVVCSREELDRVVFVLP